LAAAAGPGAVRVRAFVEGAIAAAEWVDFAVGKLAEVEVDPAWTPAESRAPLRAAADRAIVATTKATNTRERAVIRAGNVARYLNLVKARPSPIHSEGV